MDIALNNNGLNFTLDGHAEALSLSLNNNGELSFGLKTPTIIGIDYYDGDYEVTPKSGDSTTLETKGLLMREDVTVLEIPYFETSNESGYTVYIGSEV